MYISWFWIIIAGGILFFLGKRAGKQELRDDIEDEKNDNNYPPNPLIKY